MLLAGYFLVQKQTAAFAFSAFFFFENWLYTATYMADARAMVLPLVTAGGGDYVEHDWNAIFTSLGVLQYDTKIAAAVSLLGWCGMLATVAGVAKPPGCRSSAVANKIIGDLVLHADPVNACEVHRAQPAYFCDRVVFSASSGGELRADASRA